MGCLTRKFWDLGFGLVVLVFVFFFSFPFLNVCYQASSMKKEKEKKKSLVLSNTDLAARLPRGFSEVLCKNVWFYV